MDSHSSNLPNLTQKILEIFKENLACGFRKNKRIKKFAYISPNIKHLPHQYLYNSCLHIIVNSHLNLPLAIQEFNTILKTQNNIGNINSTYNWSEDSKIIKNNFNLNVNEKQLSLLNQPILLALALKSVYLKMGTEDILNENLEKISKYYNYFYDSNINLNDKVKLLTIKNRRYSRYKDILLNCVFIQNLRDLAFLYDKINNDEKKKFYKNLARQLEQELIKNCWNSSESMFFGLYGFENQMSNIKTISSLIPLILNNLPPNIANKLVYEHLLNENEFWSPFPVPLIAKNQFLYKENQNSPYMMSTCIDLNWFISLGLMKHGFINLAVELSEKTIEMVRLNGFYKFYNSETGKGKVKYSTASIVLDLSKKLETFNSSMNFVFDREWNRIKRLPDF